uniref:Tafazzin family protein n=1 Tax=Trichuris muris TaxID=70415 RepID=A0A5S6QX95_TRIMR
MRTPCGSSMSSVGVICAVGALSKIWISWMNTAEVHHMNALVNCLRSGSSLITVSNHHSCIDEPLIWGVLPWRFYFRRPPIMRWAMAAKEIVFTNPLYSAFFSSGRCIPVVRGMGVYQAGVDRCLDVLNNNGWIHVFPEGRVNFSRAPMRLKWGVGRLINEAKRVPMVLPIWHIGMEKVLPEHACVPRILKKVLIYFGKPIDRTVFEKVRASSHSKEVKRIKSTDIIHAELYSLQRHAEKLYHSNGP